MSQAITESSMTPRTGEDLREGLGTSAHWALRIALASVFIFHGAQKFAELGGFAQMMNLPYFFAFLVAAAELVGGTLILAGGISRDWITRLGGALLIPVMIGAISMVHWGQWSFVPSESYPMGGSEFQVTLLLVALYFVLKGNRD
jgi:putative oxidoreductase